MTTPIIMLVLMTAPYLVLRVLSAISGIRGQYTYYESGNRYTVPRIAKKYLVYIGQWQLAFDL